MTNKPQDEPVERRLMPRKRTNIPKVQHYVSATYLKGFSTDGKIAHHSRTTDKLEVTGVAGVAALSHFNTLRDAEGARCYALEDAYTQIEGWALIHIHAIQKQALDADPGANVETLLDETAKRRLARFVATSLWRTPDAFASIANIAAQLEALAPGANFSEREKVTRLIAIMTNGRVDDGKLRRLTNHMMRHSDSERAAGRLPPRPHAILAYFLGVRLGRELLGRSWRLVFPQSKEPSFITTDAPVRVTDNGTRTSSQQGVDAWGAESLIFMPLAATCVLVIHGRTAPPSILTADDAMVQRLNEDIALNRKDYLFGHQRSLVADIAKLRSVASRPYAPKAHVVLTKKTP